MSIERKKKRANLSGDEKAELKTLFFENKGNAKKVAEITGLHHQTVLYHANKNGWRDELKFGGRKKEILAHPIVAEYAEKSVKDSLTILDSLIGYVYDEIARKFKNNEKMKFGIATLVNMIEVKENIIARGHGAPPEDRVQTLVNQWTTIYNVSGLDGIKKKIAESQDELSRINNRIVAFMGENGLGDQGETDIPR